MYNTVRKVLSKITKKKAIKPIDPDTSNLIVKVIEDDTTSFQVALGLTDENLQRLVKIGEQALRDTKTISAALEILSRSCNHANELAYMCYAIGASRETSRIRHEGEETRSITINGGDMPDELKELLEKLFKKRGKKGPDGQ